MASDERTVLWVGHPEPCAEREIIASVAGALDLAVHFCAAAEVAGRMRAARCELVAVELGEQPAPGLAVIRDLHVRLPHLTLVAAAADNSVELIGAAFEAGASEFLSLPVHASDLQKALLKFTRHQVKRAAPPAVSGEIVTVYGVRGGLGTTTLAVNLAVQLALLSQERVVVADLDLQRGDVAAFLNLAPPQSLSGLAAAGREIDDAILHHTLVRHASGIFVLAAPAQIMEADAISHEKVAGVLRLLRTQWNYTVVDTPRALTETTLPAFEQADRILVLTDLSVPGVRAARRIVELLSVLGIAGERIELVITEMVRGPVTIEDAMRAIGRAPVLTIPRDEAAAGQAMNAGAPLNGSRPAPLTVALRRLALHVSGGTAASARRTGVLGRLFGRTRRDAG